MRSLPHHGAEELTEFVQVAGASSNPGPSQDQQVSLCEICVKGADLTEFRKLPFCFFSKAMKSYETKKHSIPKSVYALLKLVYREHYVTTS